MISNFVVKNHKVFISVLGTPQPTIKWLRNGRELSGREPGVSILEDGMLLVIASVTPYDNGEYICVAVNEAGTTEKKYNLKVHGKNRSKCLNHFQIIPYISYSLTVVLFNINANRNVIRQNW